MQNCETYHHMIMEYIDTELNQSDEGELFAHLAACPACRNEFRLQQRVANLAMKQQPEIPPHLEERIFSTIREKERETKKVVIPRAARVYIKYALAASLALIMLLTYSYTNRLQEENEILFSRYRSALQQVDYRTQQMDILMKSVPAVYVSGDVDKINN